MRSMERRFSMEEGTMYDLLYVAGTIVFFALMVAYVAGCHSLGRDADAPAEDAR